MVIKNLENKIKLVMIVSCLFMVGCIIISLGSVPPPLLHPRA